MQGFSTMTMSWKRSEMRVTTNANLILLSNVYYTNNSLLVYLHKVCHNEEKEIRTRHNNQQQQHNTHTFKRWKNCNHSDNCISYRTYRMRSLLAYYLKYVSYNVPWMWKYNNTKTPFDTLQRRNIMSYLLQVLW